MLSRRQLPAIEAALARQPAVALLGPRQVGKTTLALALAERRPAVYLDLESPTHRAKLQDAERFLTAHEHELVVLDEIHRVPDLFPVLRGVIDDGRRRGLRAGRFLLLGSASMELMRQSSESLAGRFALVELGPFDVTEAGGGFAAVRPLWSRGGFPESFLARSDQDSLAWRLDFVRTYLERDIPMFGPRIPSETLRRFWTMLAHEQGQILNAARLATGLGVSGQSVARYLDLLVDLLLARRLPPLHVNVGKRLVRSPRVYLRDSGLVHALLGITDADALLGHPVVGGSWEGFVVENLLAAAPTGTVPSFYRTAAGAEIDLVLDLPRGERWALEVKTSSAPTLQRGFHHAREDVRPDRCLVVHGGEGSWPLGDGVDAVSVASAVERLLAAG